MSGRLASVVLVDGRHVLGVLPPVAVEVPYWPEAQDVVAAVRETHGVEVLLLRLLCTEPGLPHGGRVSYLAEPAGPLPAGLHLTAWDGPDPLTDHPLRQRWARPGGPGGDLAWADAALETLGHPRTGPARQVRSWNLSSLWQLPTAEGPVWLKAVPPFFAHEGRLLRALAGASVPPVLAVDGGRALLGHVPGADLYTAPQGTWPAMVELLVELQAAWSGRVEELLALGLPDVRLPALAPLAADTLGRHAHELERGEVAALSGLVESLGERAAALEACGLPDGLVHGDFHRGNLVGDPGGSALTLLDWGDACVGHPLLDLAAFGASTDQSVARRLSVEAWTRRRPGSDPGRAADLVAPVAALQRAVVYRGFLDRIEPDERVYHRDDPGRWLRRAAALVSR